MEPTVRTLCRELEIHLGHLDQELGRHTRVLAAALGRKDAENTIISARKASADGRESEEALRNLAFNGLSIGLSVPFDLWGLITTGWIRNLVKKEGLTAGRLFARPIAALATEAIAASADGPLPISDILALLGAGWTLYDVHAARRQFARELRTPVAAMMPGLRDTFRGAAYLRAHDILTAHQRDQEAIRGHAVSHSESFPFFALTR